ncbi:unnamed protein product, partial [Discosporangium mesarthrocarpum]
VEGQRWGKGRKGPSELEGLRGAVMGKASRLRALSAHLGCDEAVGAAGGEVLQGTPGAVASSACHSVRARLELIGRVRRFDEQLRWATGIHSGGGNQDRGGAPLGQERASQGEAGGLGLGQGSGLGLDEGDLRGLETERLRLYRELLD